MARRPPSTSVAQPTWQRETPEIMALLFQQHPNAFTELDFRTPFDLLVATILSAQSTDRRVNEVTPALFAKYPDAATLAKASPPDLEREIKTTGFFRMKAKALIGMSRILVDEHGGEVPARLEALVALPGVGRKTANVVLGHALGVPGLPVDRHVLRVANRIGIAHAATPEDVEAQLCAAMPRDQWTLTSDTLILHGRRICRPRPLCEQCAVVERCDFARAWKRGPAHAAPGDLTAGTRTAGARTAGARTAGSRIAGTRTADAGAGAAGAGAAGAGAPGRTARSKGTTRGAAGAGAVRGGGASPRGKGAATTVSVAASSKPGKPAGGRRSSR